jgi:hypothetical protein
MRSLDSLANGHNAPAGAHDMLQQAHSAADLTGVPRAGFLASVGGLWGKLLAAAADAAADEGTHAGAESSGRLAELLLQPDLVEPRCGSCCCVLFVSVARSQPARLMLTGLANMQTERAARALHCVECSSHSAHRCDPELSHTRHCMRRRMALAAVCFPEARTLSLAEDDPYLQGGQRNPSRTLPTVMPPTTQRLSCRQRRRCSRVARCRRSLPLRRAGCRCCCGASPPKMPVCGALPRG